MSGREFLRLLVVAVVVALICVSLTGKSAGNADGGGRDKPRRPLVKKIAKWVAIWWLVKDSSAPGGQVQASHVDKLQNMEPTQAAPGSGGGSQPINHAYGW